MVSTVIICTEEIIEIAKNIQRLMKSLQEHQHRHCHHIHREGDAPIYQCHLPRCMARIHTSISALQTHIDNGHMSRIPIPCPFVGCKTAPFSRVQHLVAHIEGFHTKLLGTVVQLPSDLFQASSRPFNPPPSPPPPLPVEPVLACLLLTPCVNAAARKKGRVIPSTQSATPSRKRTLLYIKEDQELDSTPELYGDLSIFPASETHELRDFIVRPSPTSVDLSLSRPQPMRNPPPLETRPPVSFLYDTFARRVDELESGKLLS